MNNGVRTGNKNNGVRTEVSENSVRIDVNNDVRTGKKAVYNATCMLKGRSVLGLRGDSKINLSLPWYSTNKGIMDRTIGSRILSWTVPKSFMDSTKEFNG